jgi:hypothetical protein
VRVWHIHGPCELANPGRGSARNLLQPSEERAAARIDHAVALGVTDEPSVSIAARARAQRRHLQLVAPSQPSPVQRSTIKCRDNSLAPPSTARRDGRPGRPRVIACVAPSSPTATRTVNTNIRSHSSTRSRTQLHPTSRAPVAGGSDVCGGWCSDTTESQSDVLASTRQSVPLHTIQEARLHLLLAGIEKDGRAHEQQHPRRHGPRAI